MDAIVRLGLGVCAVTPTDAPACLQKIKEAIDGLIGEQADIVVFPQLALTSPCCGNFFKSDWLLTAAKAALDDLAAYTCQLESYIIVGLPIAGSAMGVSAMAVLHRGQVLGLMGALGAPPAPGLTAPALGDCLPPDTLFACGELTFAVLPCQPLHLPQYMHLAGGADLVIVPAYHPIATGYTTRVQDTARVVSDSYGCAVALCCGGLGDSSAPYLYRGFTAVYECGVLLCGEIAYEGTASLCDLDTDIIRAGRGLGPAAPFYRAPVTKGKHGLLRQVATNPYVQQENEDAFYNELFELQAQSLADRMQNTKLETIVLGLSGGLDSTLAALVAAAALDRLSLPRHHLHCITMPGFGTTDGTLWSALSLTEALGAQGREISIAQVVLQHFADIGHDPNLRNTTYENAQARERTQILFDIANTQNALVLGTGDLAEIALGWSTFGGDQFASYNVNMCLTKTMVRGMVNFIAKSSLFVGLSDILFEVLARPVSPELLPPDGDGSILQRTEDILGPYQIHEFFLYYLCRYAMRPSKILAYAIAAFAGIYSPDYLRDRLRFFLQKFVAGQFKRSCSPDGAILTPVHLANATFYIPSDLSPQALLRQLDETIE